MLPAADSPSGSDLLVVESFCTCEEVSSKLLESCFDFFDMASSLVQEGSLTGPSLEPATVEGATGPEMLRDSSEEEQIVEGTSSLPLDSCKYNCG